MVSGPAKSARRLTSLFLGRGDKNSNSNDEKTSNGTKLAKKSPQSTPPQTSPQAASSVNSLRHSASTQHLTPEPDARNSAASRNVSAPLPWDSANDELLAPPPSLAAINPDLQSSNDNHRRRQSWGASLTNLTTNLSRPGSRSSLRPGSRPMTPNASSRLSKGLSWVPKFQSSPVDPMPEKNTMRAWVISAHSQVAFPYDVSRLAAGDIVRDLRVSETLVAEC